MMIFLVNFSYQNGIIKLVSIKHDFLSQVL